MRWPNQRIFLPLLVLLFFVSTPFVGVQSKYPKTIYALQERYVDEIHGVHKYLAYAQKALSEDYCNIAYLFVALAASESVHAATVEIEEIDHEYPRLIEYVKPEKHEAAIQNITYAWKAEKQHRDLLKKVLSRTGVFFRLLAKKIEKTDVQFFVCQRCGSTLTELPKNLCPICKGPVAQYKEVERIK